VGHFVSAPPAFGGMAAPQERCVEWFKVQGPVESSSLQAQDTSLLYPGVDESKPQDVEIRKVKMEVARTNARDRNHESMAPGPDHPSLEDEAFAELVAADHGLGGAETGEEV